MSKVRIQVSLPGDVVDKLNEAAKKIGLSRSSLCGAFIIHGLYNGIDSRIFDSLLIDYYNELEKKEP